jgi:O-antigen ligase
MLGAPHLSALISSAGVWSPAERAAPREHSARFGRSPGFLLALLFLLVNFAARFDALRSTGLPATLLGVVVVLAAVACLVRPAWLGPALAAFGSSFFLYGFHSYSTRNQAFELVLTALAVVLVLRLLRGPQALVPTAMPAVLPFAVLYALAATFSLLLLPPRVLEHRAFLEGGHLAQALLTAFPKDPLYPIASVNRLWLFLTFAVALSAQAEAGALYRRLVRGIAWAVIVAVVLGLLDFAGVLSLARYNQSQVFFGAGYRRLQSTFGNPGWFACFVACAVPFVLLEWSEPRRWLRLVLAASFPLTAASLFLSGARASWIAGLGMLAALAALRFTARQLGRPLPAQSPLDKAVLAASLAVFALLVVFAAGLARAPADSQTPPDRLEGLSREIRTRGLGLTSPRRVAAEYAIELARERPLLGLGYESFNMHLRAQLARPGSPVTRVVNTAVLQDPTETVFDDSHNTYLQVLVGNGVLGLLLWLTLVATSLAVTLRAFARAPSPLPVAVALGLLTFHLYGLFQGMAYLPVIFFLFHVELGLAMTLDPGPLPDWLAAGRRWAVVLLAVLVLVALPFQALDRGYRSLKRALAVEAYLPDEAAEFEGFYAPETGPSGEFRWMTGRGIVNVSRAAPFSLSFTCAHPDLEREPVVVSLRFEGRDEGVLVCQHPGTLEKRFDLGTPGALRLRVSRTFRPGRDDRRELGLAVSAIRWE